MGHSPERIGGQIPHFGGIRTWHPSSVSVPPCEAGAFVQSLTQEAAERHSLRVESKAGRSHREGIESEFKNKGLTPRPDSIGEWGMRPPDSSDSRGKS